MSKQTTCPSCGWPDASECVCDADKPRQPATSARIVNRNGDYVELVDGKFMFNGTHDQTSHAHALNEMGATTPLCPDCAELILVEQQLAAAQGEIAALKDMLSNSNQNFNHAKKERDELKQHLMLTNEGWTTQFHALDKLAACELRAGEYEKALEEIKNRPESGPWIKIAREVLTKHRRGGES